MPSAFGHILIPLSLRLGLGARRMGWRLAAFCAASAAAPDLDVIGFVFHIPYGSPWGHRGASHSLVAALLWALISMLWAKQLYAPRWLVFLLVWISTTSHTLLDACTNGGKGVALLWPFTNERFFLPLRPIQVSPIGTRFFSPRAFEILGSELCWVGLPSLGIAVAILIGRWLFGRKTS